MWDLRAATEVGAKLVRPRPPYEVTGATCDSRQVCPGDIFVALRGQRHDGHDFLAEAFSRGAVGALVSRELEAGYNLLLVDDVERALWDLAAWRRGNLSIPALAVTGSFGKSTTKELLAQALATRYRTFRTPKSYNTELGVPLALLSVPDDAEVAVFELGATVKGEIQRLSELVCPWAGIITGVGEAHLATLGTVEEVVETKWELALALPEEGVLALAWDFPELKRRAERFLGVCLRFGRTEGADFSPREVVADDPEGVRFMAVTLAGEVQVRLQLLGAHVATLACGAMALAWAMGVPAEAAARAFAEVPPLPHRLQLRKAPFGWVLDDCYNANPLSMRAALRTLISLRLPVKQRVALLGDMLDLGSVGGELHREIVEEARWQGVDALFCFGPHLTSAFAAWGGPGAAEAEELAALLPAVEAEVRQAPTLLLVKGSRGMALERAVERLAP
jgi:UDP-N-acetylmuramoyl-tripeptide--D-alanyl-D-alanine ligase